MARQWTYYEYDDAFFRGPADIVGVNQVWDTTDQKWTPYLSADLLKPAMFGEVTTQEKAESQHWENDRLVVNF